MFCIGADIITHVPATDTFLASGLARLNGKLMTVHDLHFHIGRFLVQRRYIGS